MKYGPIEYYSILKQKEKMIRTPRYLINFKKQIGRLYLLLVWRRKRQPTPVFLPRESHGQGSLAGYSRKESDVTKATVRACTHKYISHSCPSGFNKARSLSFFVYMFFLRKPTAMQNKTSAHQKFNSEMNFPEG